MEGRCRGCGRLLYDVEDKAMLPDALKCQHCGHVNIIKRKPKAKTSRGKKGGRGR